MLYGIDVSEWQGKPDYRAVAAAGIDFVIARTSYGTKHPDLDYAYNRDAIHAHGLLAGAYHFLVNGQPAADQADTFIKIADPKAFHFLDVEVKNLDVAGFVNRYRRTYPNKTLGIYTGRDLWRAAVGNVNGSGYGPLWVAGAVPNGYVPGSGTVQALYAKVGSQDGGTPFAGWAKPLLMQHTAQAQVPGISGPVDGDVFYGNESEWARYAGGTTPVPHTYRIPQSVADMVHDMQAALNGQVAVDHAWGPNTDRCISALHEMKDGIAGSFDTIKLAQRCIGVNDDGDWGPESRAAFEDTVTALQAAWRYVNLALVMDGQWGPATEAAYANARAVAFGTF